MTHPSIRFLSFAREYFTDEFRCPNIVDVPDDQGLLQNGMVVDMTENGFLVDFFCKGQQPRLVKYGQLFHCEDDSAVNDNSSGKVQVLLRLSRDRPSAWYSAECFDIDTSLLYRRELIKIKLELEGAVVEEIVHISQIRSVPVDSDEPIDKDYFETGSCRVPNHYAFSGTEPSPLWKMCYRDLQKYDSTHVMRIRDGNVEYLRRRDKTRAPVLEHRLRKQRQPFDLKDCLDCVAQRMECCLESGLMWSGKFFSRSLVSALPDEGPTSVPFRCLPIDILVETFQYLESVDRVWLRRVSSNWDGVLSTEALFKDVWVGLKYRYDCPFKWSVWDTLHAVALALIKLVTKTTKWVIIVGSSDTHQPDTEDQRVEKPLGLISDIARYFTLPSVGKLNVIVSQFHWCPEDRTSLHDCVEKVANLCNSCASVCDTLLWKHCTFEHLIIEEAILPIRRGSIKVASPTLQADLWEMLGRNAPEVKLKKLRQWLARGASTKGGVLLEEFQTPDPRITDQSTLYREDELEQLEWGKLDVGRLTRLTLWALSAEMAKKASRGTKRPRDDPDYDPASR